MNVLSNEKKIQVLKLLVEGNTIRGTERLTGVHRDTIVRLVLQVGQNCQAYMDEHLRLVWCNHVEIDEMHTTVWKKEGRIPHADKNPEIGDQYVFVAIDRDTKLVPVFLVGKRSYGNAYKFLKMLKGCLINTCQLSSDQFNAYSTLVRVVFGLSVHYAQIKKMYYNGTNYGRSGYNPATLQGAQINIKIGHPVREKISTSFVERQNLTVRMQMSRFHRLTNAFSKKLDSLKAAVAIHFWHYNFMRVHGTLKTTPAKAAGIEVGEVGWECVL